MRDNYTHKKKEEYEYIKKKIVNEPVKYDNTERALLIDVDSIIYTSVYNPDRYKKTIIDEITGELLSIPMTEDEILAIPQEVVNLDIKECKFRLTKKIQEIQNNIEQYFNIKKTLLLCGGENNFRYQLLKEYKANRKSTLPYLKEIKQYAIDNLNAFSAPSGEADDMIYHFWNLAKNNSIIATIDKDIKSSCYGLFYNYRSHKDIEGEFYTVTEKESKFNLCCQILIGDPGDNVKVNKGLGIKGVLKIINPDMPDFTLKRKILETYIKYNGEEAKKLLKTIYKIIKLHTFEEIEKINLDYKK